MICSPQPILAWKLNPFIGNRMRVTARSVPFPIPGLFRWTKRLPITSQLYVGWPGSSAASRALRRRNRRPARSVSHASNSPSKSELIAACASATSSAYGCIRPGDNRPTPGPQLLQAPPHLRKSLIQSPQTFINFGRHRAVLPHPAAPSRFGHVGILG